jgi:hypothetical protein
MNKKILVALVVFASIAAITLVFFKRPQKESIDQEYEDMQKTTYDPVKENGSNDSTQYENLKMGQTFTPSAVFFQTFDSGQTTRVELPLIPVAKSRIIDQDDIKGLIYLNEEYQMMVYHLLSLRQSTDFCQRTIDSSRLERERPTSDFIENIEVDRGFGSRFDITNDKGTDEVGFRLCFPDTDSKAFVIELFINKNVYAKKYEALIPKIVRGFEFTKE